MCTHAEARSGGRAGWPFSCELWVVPMDTLFVRRNNPLSELKMGTPFARKQHAGRRKSPTARRKKKSAYRCRKRSGARSQGSLPRSSATARNTQLSIIMRRCAASYL